MNLKNIPFKSRLLVAFMLLFSGIADLLIGELVFYKSVGITIILIVLAFVFILQDAFKWVRLSLLGIMAALVFYRLCLLIGNLDVIIPSMIRMMIDPAAIPLYTALLLIGILSFLTLKTDWIIIHRK